MQNPNEKQQRALKNMDPELVGFFQAALAEEDRQNRRRLGQAGDVGSGRAQVLDEILELVDGATAPPIN